MNGGFWRLAWKEYRTLRSLWLAVALLAMLLSVVMLATAISDEAGRQMVFVVALGVPVLYALGCGAVLFAAEKEDGTYAVLQMLPLQNSTLLKAKLTTAIASLALLALVLHGLALLLSKGQLPTTDVYRQQWGLLGLMMLEAFAWAALFSLRSTRALQAAVLGSLAASVATHLIVWTVQPDAQPFDSAAYVAALPYRAVLVAIVLLGDVWIARRWLAEREGSSRARGKWLFRGWSKGRTEPRFRDPSLPVRSLVWQQWREGRRLIATYYVLGVFAALAARYGMEHVLQGSWAFTAGSYYPRAEPLVTFLLMVVFVLLGSSVFMSDQEQRRVQFLADRGVYPRKLWLSRQLLWLPTTVILAALVHFIVYFGPYAFAYRFWGVDERMEHPDWFAYGFSQLPPAGHIFALLLTAYASGQLASMLLRSTLLAAITGILIALPLGVWGGTMLLLDVPWIWSVLPIPAVLLGITYWHARKWMDGRGAAQGWWALSIAGSALLLALYGTAASYRVAEVPYVHPQHLPAVRPLVFTAPAREVAEAYQRIGERMQSRSSGTSDEAGTGEDRPARAVTWPWYQDPTHQRWLADNVELLPDAVAVSLEPVVDFSRIYEWHEKVTNVRDLLLTAAQARRAEGDLDEALRYYLAALRVEIHIQQNGAMSDRRSERLTYDLLQQWAAHPAQNPQLLRRGLAELNAIEALRLSAADLVKVQYFELLDWVQGDTTRAAMLPQQLTHSPRLRDAMLAWLPGEQRRAERGLAVWLVRTRDRVRRLQVLAESQTDDWLATTPSFWGLEHEFIRQPMQLAEEAAMTEAAHRATEIIFALCGWRIQHGELPQRLEQLEGDYFSEIPRDTFYEPHRWNRPGAPESGVTFGYFRRGIPIPLVPESLGYRLVTYPSRVTANQPFLWTLGFQESPVVDADGNYEPPQFAEQPVGDEWDYRTWSRGVAFEIPSPGR